MGTRFFVAVQYLALVLGCITLLISSEPAEAQAPAARAGEYLMKVAGSRNRGLQIQAQLGVRELRRHPLSGASLVEADAQKGFDHQLAKQLIASGVVEYFEPNYILSINQTTPNDPEFANLWGLQNSGQSGGSADADIDAPEAWDLHQGDSSIVVGVVDTGIDYSHPDLASRMWRNPNEIPGNGVDDDGNGVIDDVFGYDAVEDDGDPADLNGHGTHCAGTISASGNNGVGIAGVSWHSKLMALRFLNANGSGSTSDAISVIEYAVRMRQRGVNLRVLSNSWGGGGYSQALRDAIAAANANGILFVVAAGNSSNDNDFNATYPASYDVANIVSVAAVDHNGNLANFSNYGASSVHLAAPGVNIYSTKPGGGYQYLSGTSMAAPHVSGVASLLMSHQPELNHLQVRDRILQTTKAFSSLTGVTLSGGIVNASNALRDIQNPIPPQEDLPGYRDSAINAVHNTYGSKVLSVDDGYSEQWLPFNFPYFGHSYNRIAISANGRIIPLSEGEAVPSGYDYYNRLTRAISPYHDDLYPSPHSSEGGVWIYSSSEEVRVTWVVTHYGDRNSSSAGTEMRVQARLLRSGRIEFHYLDTDADGASWSNAGSATIGLAPGSGVAGRSLLLSHESADASRFGSGRGVAFDVDESDGEPETPTPPAPPAPRPTPSKGDVDGDGKRDIVVWRPRNGYWYILQSSTSFDFAQHRAIQHGLPGDSPFLGDFDHDGIADLAVWRPRNGTWYLRLSSSQFTTTRIIQWGLFGDRPFIGDYDGDGWDDLGVYRVSTGTFYVLKSANGFNSASAVRGDRSAYLSVQLGGAANDVVVGDFLGNGRDDFTTVWQLVRFWSVKDYSGHMHFSLPWGYPGDTPLGCKFMSTVRDARTVVRVEPDFTLNWYSVDLNGSVQTASFGSIADIPGCDDYDGDGIEDKRVYRSHTGEWFIQHSGSSALQHYSFGLPGDVPL